MLATLNSQVDNLKREKDKLQAEIQEKQSVQLKERIRRMRLGGNKVIPMHALQTAEELDELMGRVA